MRRPEQLSYGGGRGEAGGERYGSGEAAEQHRSHQAPARRGRRLSGVGTTAPAYDQERQPYRQRQEPQQPQPRRRQVYPVEYRRTEDGSERQEDGYVHRGAGDVGREVAGEGHF